MSRSNWQNKAKIMKRAGRILATIFKEIEKEIAPGIDVWVLEEKFLDLCKKYNVKPACKGYNGGVGTPFPTGLCISINDECVHCYPIKDTILKEGDIIVVDTDIELDGYFVDGAFTKAVGNISEIKERLLNTTKLALQAGINQAKPGGMTGDISNAIQTVVEMAGFNVLRDYTGHGIGERMHQYPTIPCFGEKGSGVIIEPGMTFTIEPLVCTGSNVVISRGKDAWATKMKDGGFFAMFEHTILITEKGIEILTKV